MLAKASQAKLRALLELTRDKDEWPSPDQSASVLVDGMAMFRPICQSGRFADSQLPRTVMPRSRPMNYDDHLFFPFFGGMHRLVNAFFFGNVSGCPEAFSYGWWWYSAMCRTKQCSDFARVPPWPAHLRAPHLLHCLSRCEGCVSRWVGNSYLKFSFMPAQESSQKACTHIPQKRGVIWHSSGRPYYSPWLTNQLPREKGSRWRRKHYQSLDIIALHDHIRHTEWCDAKRESGRGGLKYIFAYFALLSQQDCHFLTEWFDQGANVFLCW